MKTPHLYRGTRPGDGSRQSVTVFHWTCWPGRVQKLCGSLLCDLTARGGGWGAFPYVSPLNTYRTHCSRWGERKSIKSMEKSREPINAARSVAACVIKAVQSIFLWSIIFYDQKVADKTFKKWKKGHFGCAKFDFHLQIVGSYLQLFPLTFPENWLFPWRRPLDGGVRCFLPLCWGF